PYFLLSDKPTIFACNVKEGDLATPDTNPYVMKVREYVQTHLSCEAVVISALSRSTYHLLGLQTYFTAGEKEVRAWTIHQGDTAPKAAGVIHSDFERGFIKAEVVSFDDLVAAGSMAAAKAAGKVRMEGKEYVMADGDVVEFRFNV